MNTQNILIARLPLRIKKLLTLFRVIDNLLVATNITNEYLSSSLFLKKSS